MLDQAQVFIAYVSENSGIADHLVKDLREAGVKAWLTGRLRLIHIGEPSITLLAFTHPKASCTIRVSANC
jgi:hypothetical protein